MSVTKTAITLPPSSGTTSEPWSLYRGLIDLKNLVFQVFSSIISFVTSCMQKLLGSSTEASPLQMRVTYVPKQKFLEDLKNGKAVVTRLKEQEGCWQKLIGIFSTTPLQQAQKQVHALEVLQEDAKRFNRMQEQIDICEQQKASRQNQREMILKIAQSNKQETLDLEKLASLIERDYGERPPLVEWFFNRKKDVWEQSIDPFSNLVADYRRIEQILAQQIEDFTSKQQVIEPRLKPHFDKTLIPVKV